MTGQVVVYFHMSRHTFIGPKGKINDTGWKYQYGPIYSKDIAFARVPHDIEWTDGAKSMYKVMEGVIEVKESVRDS